MPSLVKTLRFNFAAAALVLLCSSLITLYNSARWSSEGQAVGDTHAILSQLQDLQAALTDAETGQRGYLLTRDTQYLRDYISGSTQCRALLVKVQTSRISGLGSAAKMQSIALEKLAELAKTVELGRSQDYQAALAIVGSGRGQELMGQFRKLVSAMKAQQVRELARRQEDLRKTRFLASVAAITGSVLALFSTLFFAWRSHHDVTLRQQAERTLDMIQRRFDAFMRFNPCLAFIKDAEGRMLYVNASLERVFNIRLSDWEGKDDFSLWTADLAQQLRATDLKVLAGDSPVEIIETIPNSDGSLREYLSVKFPFTVEGSGRCLGGLAFDVTERRVAETALRESEKFNRSILESSQDCIKVLSLSGNLLFMNSGGQRQLGICRVEPLLKSSWIDFWKDENRDLAAQAVAAAARGEHGRFEALSPNFIGEFKWWHVVISPILDDAGSPERLLCISRDITEAKVSEQKLSASEARYRELFDKNPLAAWIYNTETFEFLDINQAAAENYGYSRNEFLSLRISDIRVPEQMQLVEQDLVEAVYSNRRSGPWRHRRKDGSLVTVELNAHAVEWLDSSARLVMVHDISERIDSETKFRLLFEESSEARFLQDERGIVDCNHAALRLLKVTHKDLLFGVHPGITFSPALQPCGRPSAELVRENVARLDYEESIRFDWLIHRSDGTPLPIEVCLSRVQINGAPFRISVWHDLSERNLAADKIRASLAEKEVLLREVHHRVKNNLQVICSLLSMQSQTITDHKTLEALRESQDRVQSMAMIHELLYDSSSLSDIDFAEYAGLLAGELASSYGLDRADVRLSLQVEPIRFALDQAVPCGLILNELVSNAFKHAYPQGLSGEIRIGLCRDELSRVRLSVADDGVGLPSGFEWSQSNSLGLRIVDILSRQLGGSMDVVSNHGSSFEVVFSTN